jgi:ComF family protein
MTVANVQIVDRDGVLSYRRALYEYDGRAGQAVRRLKFARSTVLAPFMAGEIAKAVRELDVDLIVPVPIHLSRRNQRGFNQSELLASALPSHPQMLTRIRATRPQVGLNREQRTRNLQGAFRASPEVRGQRILLIDDVVTSGQTARECARELLDKGAYEVSVLAFCGEAQPEV